VERIFFMVKIQWYMGHFNTKMSEIFERTAEYTRLPISTMMLKKPPNYVVPTIVLPTGALEILVRNDMDVNKLRRLSNFTQNSLDTINQQCFYCYSTFHCLMYAYLSSLTLSAWESCFKTSNHAPTFTLTQKLTIWNLL
jgi:hypothetical protein